MLKNSRLILAAAVMAAIPAVSKAAVTFTVSLDPNITYGPVNGTMSTLPLVAGTNGAYFNSTTGTAYIPAGDAITYGYDGLMSGTNSALAPSIGIGQFAILVNNSTGTVAVPSNGTATAAASTKGALIFDGTNHYAYNSAFTGTGFGPNTIPKAGSVSGNVGYTTPVPGGSLGIVVAPSNIPTSYAPVGAAAPALLVSGLEFDLLSSTPGASTTLTVATSGTTFGGNNDFYLTGGGGGAYGDSLLSASDSDVINYSPATLTIVVAGGVTTTTTTSTTVSHQPIVTLLNTTPSTYGTQIGSPIVITGHNSSYTVGYTGTSLTQVGGQGYTTGYTAVSVFNPLTDTEVYALKLNASGAALSPTSTEIALIVADLNLGTGTGTAAVNVSAGAVVGSPYAALFPGYDILLVSTGAFGGAGNGGVADLGIDFSQDTDALTPGLVVTEVAAVPEPATAAGVVLGAAGLLLGRRKKQIATA